MAMPAFGEAYSDAEIAAAANYVTARVRRPRVASDGGERGLVSASRGDSGGLRRAIRRTKWRSHSTP